MKVEVGWRELPEFEPDGQRLPVDPFIHIFCWFWGPFTFFGKAGFKSVLPVFPAPLSGDRGGGLWRLLAGSHLTGCLQTLNLSCPQKDGGNTHR